MRFATTALGRLYALPRQLPATLAALLLLADCAIVLFMGGAFAAATRSVPKRGATAAVLLALVAGALIGRANEPNQCRYRDRYGQIYLAACPRGY